MTRHFGQFFKSPCSLINYGETQSPSHCELPRERSLSASVGSGGSASPLGIPPGRPPLRPGWMPWGGLRRNVDGGRRQTGGSQVLGPGFVVRDVPTLPPPRPGFLPGGGSQKMDLPRLINNSVMTLSVRFA